MLGDMGVERPENVKEFLRAGLVPVSGEAGHVLRGIYNGVVFCCAEICP